MKDKNRGLYNKYHVQKISNPEKKIDAIVLEFDDPIARRAIRPWANSMIYAGFNKVGHDVHDKLDRIEFQLATSEQDNI